MNSKTLVTTVLSVTAALGLLMGTVAFAQNTDHMGHTQTSTSQDSNDTMHGKTVQKNSHGSMHVQSGQNQNPVTGHHTDINKTTDNYPCHDDTVVKGGKKT